MAFEHVDCLLEHDKGFLSALAALLPQAKVRDRRAARHRSASDMSGVLAGRAGGRSQEASCVPACSGLADSASCTPSSGRQLASRPQGHGLSALTAACAQRPIVLLGNQQHPPRGLPAKHLQSFAFAAPLATSLQQCLARLGLAASPAEAAEAGPAAGARMRGDVRCGAWARIIGAAGSSRPCRLCKCALGRLRSRLRMHGPAGRPRRPCS